MLHNPYQMTMRWWNGVVENRQDPLHINRVQVRVMGIHTDNLQQLPESDLHWMQVMMPVTSASNSGIGETANLIEGSHVIGFYLDGDSCQNGIIIGSVNGIPQESRKKDKGFSDHRSDLSPNNVPGNPSNIDFKSGVGVVISDEIRSAYPNRLDEPDLHRLSSGVNINKDFTILNKNKSQTSHNNIAVASGGNFSQPISEYKSRYPYNIVTSHECGSLLEFDNTPKNERVHIYHRSSTFIEMLPLGDSVCSTAKDSYNLTQNNSYTNVGNNSVITIQKGMKLLVNASGGDSLELELGAGGNLNINVKSGDVNLNVTGNVSHKISGDYVINVGGSYKLNASRIDLN